MTKINPDNIISLIKFLDENFLDDNQYEETRMLNINDPEDQRVIIRKIIVPGFLSMNKITQDHLKSVVSEFLYVDKEYQSIFDSISTPFDFSEVNFKDFVKIIREEIEAIN